MVQIENTNYVLKNLKRMYIYTILLALIIPFVLLSEFFEKPILGISKNIIVLTISAIYILYYVIRYILDLNFIQFTIENGKIILRYYSLRPLAKNHRSIEIPLASFEGYKIKKRFFGLKKELILFQKIQGKMAKYPPVSITALKKDEISLLTNMLSSLIKN